MAVRAYVTFDDAKTPIGEPAADAPPPGRALADELAHALQRQGLSIAGHVSQWESYGWEFTVSADGRHVWLMLQASDHWLVVSDTRRTFLERLRGVTGEDAHGRVLSGLAAVLTGPRFANVRWLTKAEFEGRHPGADSPTA